jgi:ribosomal protein L11 methyltransferase
MIQISLITDRARLDQVEQVLWEHGAQSVTLRDAAEDPVLEPLPGETPVWPEVIVIGLFNDDVNAEMLRQALDGLIHASVFEVMTIAERDWPDACLDDLKPLRFGRRLRVCPSSYGDLEPNMITIWLDPGLAFGTGTHPTTALCLEWLDANPPHEAEVIDYGCGSGILSLAAIKLGANHVRAVDIDPQALAATLDNAARNGISHRQIIACPPADLPDASADLLLANILARPLIELAENFARRLRTNGRLILSGMLTYQTAQLASAYARWFDFAPVRSHDGWALMEGTKR